MDFDANSIASPPFGGGALSSVESMPFDVGSGNVPDETQPSQYIPGKRAGFRFPFEVSRRRTFCLAIILRRALCGLLLMTLCISGAAHGAATGNSEHQRHVLRIFGQIGR